MGHTVPGGDDMVQCEACQRYHRPDEAACPFCNRPGRARRALHTVGGAVTTIVLAACYGAPGGGFPPPDTGGPPATGDTADTDVGPDEDGDGYRNRDCDDTNAAINPGADEICDDTIDNDCDGLIDAADPECPTP